MCCVLSAGSEHFADKSYLMSKKSEFPEERNSLSEKWKLTASENKIMGIVTQWFDEYFPKPAWASPLPILFASFTFMLLNLPVLALGLTFGYLLWVLVVIPRQILTMNVLVTLLAPALDAVPDGVTDTEFVIKTFEDSKIYETSTFRRKKTFIAYLQDRFGNIDGENACSQGHSEYCAHKAGIEGLKFWQKVLELNLQSKLH